MFSRRIQQWGRHLVMQLIRPMARFGVTPNMLTGLGFLLSLLTAGVIAQGFLFTGGLLVVLAGVFDMFDGAMARIQHTATPFGAFFDSTLDRYSESVILFGLLWYTLQRPANFRDMFWPTSHEQVWMISFIYIAIVGSLMVSYTKARAEGLGIECNVGFLARPERVVLLAIGLLFGASIWILAILAVLSHVTALERIIAIWRATQRTSRSQAIYSEAGQDIGQHEPTLRATDAHHTDLDPIS